MACFMWRYRSRLGEKVSLTNKCFSACIYFMSSSADISLFISPYLFICDSVCHLASSHTMKRVCSQRRSDANPCKCKR